MKLETIRGLNFIHNVLSGDEKDYYFYTDESFLKVDEIEIRPKTIYLHNNVYDEYIEIEPNETNKIFKMTKESEE